MLKSNSSTWAAATVTLGITLAACAGEQPGSQAVGRAPEADEPYFAGLTQLTFGGQNAEAYFSPDGTQLIFQRTDSDTTCDQQYLINTDGSGMRLVSNGLGRTTCGYFHSGVSAQPRFQPGLRLAAV
jgi:hypothetical protein